MVFCGTSETVCGDTPAQFGGDFCILGDWERRESGCLWRGETRYRTWGLSSSQYNSCTLGNHATSKFLQSMNACLLKGWYAAQSYRTAPSRARSSATRPPSLMSSEVLESYRKRAVGVNNTIRSPYSCRSSKRRSRRCRRRSWSGGSSSTRRRPTCEAHRHGGAQPARPRARGGVGHLRRAHARAARHAALRDAHTLAIEHHVDRLGVDFAIGNLRFYTGEKYMIPYTTTLNFEFKH